MATRYLLLSLLICVVYYQNPRMALGTVYGLQVVGSSSSADRSISQRWNGGGIKNKTNKRRRRNKKNQKIYHLADIPKSRTTKLTVCAHGQTKTIYKQRMETIEHVLTKAMIWKLMMDEEQEQEVMAADNLNDNEEVHSSSSTSSSSRTNSDNVRFEIEFDISDPSYIPDVVGLKRSGIPKTKMTMTTDTENTAVTSDDDDSVVVYWGESGRMKPHKAIDLIQRYCNARIIHCRWGVDIDLFADPMMEYLQQMVDEGHIEYPIHSWWNGRFSFATLPSDFITRFVDEETNELTVTKSDLEWRELDIDSITPPPNDDDDSSSNSRQQ